MFDIYCETDRYKTYVLHDRTTDFRARVVPERGGIVTQLQMGDRDLLYLDRDRFADPTLSVRGGIPILFPICGNLPDNRYTWQGQIYELPQHGFARNLPWTVTQTETDAAAALTVTLSDTSETRSVYPFAFELQFTYRLVGHCLSIEQQFSNHSQDVMPFSIGFHPYFAVTDKTQLQFELPTKVYFDRANNIAAQLDNGWDFNLDEIDAALDPTPSNNDLEARVGDREVAAQADGQPPVSTFGFLDREKQTLLLLRTLVCPSQCHQYGHRSDLARSWGPLCRNSGAGISSLRRRSSC